MGCASAAVVGLLATGCGGSASDSSGVADENIVDGRKDSTDTGVVEIFIHKRDASGNLIAGPRASGILVMPNLVLTARHVVAISDSPTAKCPGIGRPVKSDASERILVLSALTPADDLGQHNVRSVQTPAGTDDQELCGSDIAIIELSQPITGAKVIDPRLDGPATPGEKYKAVGYGLTSTDNNAPSGPASRTAKSGISVTSLGPVHHGDVYVTAGEWMAQDAPACNGDSGGPALASDGRAIGVFSRGNCSVSVYTGLDTYADWIRAAARTAAEHAGTAPPTWAQDTR